MMAALLLFAALLESKVVAGFLSQDLWPNLGDVISQELLDEIHLDNDLLNQKLSLGLFIRGVQGPGGPPGPKGPSGTSGPMGPSGTIGSKGYPGRPGPTGAPGSPGQPGAPGAQGSKGFSGPKGLPGQVGMPGYPGPSYVVHVNVTVVCEGNRAWLQCEPGHHVKITQAFWGRDDFHTCADNPSPNMTAYQLVADVDSDHVVRKLRERCTSQHRCEAQAERGLFLDQNAPQVSKYLRVWHECIPEQMDVLKYVKRARRSSSLRKREFYIPLNESAPDQPWTRSGGLNLSESSGLRVSGFVELDKSNQQMSTPKYPQKRAGGSDDMVALETILEELMDRRPMKK